MESYCVRCERYTKNINPRVSNISNGKTMILSKCAECSSQIQDFLKIKKQKDY